MLFYKLQGVWGNPNDNDDRNAKRELARRITLDTAEFNSYDSDVYIFVSDIAEDTVVLGLITKYFINPFQMMKRYTEFLCLDLRDVLADEITLNKMEHLLNAANRGNFIENDDDILENFELDKLTGRRALTYGENLTKAEFSKEDAILTAKKYYMTETLVPEMERIYAEKKTKRCVGHPVHYFIECDDRDARRDIYKTLLDALYASARLDSRRYAFLDFRAGENYSHMAYELLYKICKGGTVVVRYLAGDDSEDCDHAGGERETIEGICSMAKRFRNEVLTIFCLPRECKKVKALFYENLGSMSFIELREDFIHGSNAKEFLTALAKEKEVRTDKKLFAEVREDHSYLATELQHIFDEWYNTKLKTTIYPQYKEIASLHREEIVKAKPQGSAYEELSEMIGLHDAKQVIKKALNFYKMQKLYDEKGVKRSNPAMHMIFSGNPGTAKTTVARLFARIMRENNLLSRGHLVEVGRSDLVGKYVGWTAHTVRARFKEALGGVLFIDEAYSLVDDRGGSYGDEAINTIVQEMENHRSEVVVIFAGYPDKMEDFLAKNPGLRSRIAFHVPFADYNCEELCQIADMISRKNGMKIDKGAYDKLTKAFDIANANEDFGNGRYVRNLFEQAKMNQASRLLEKDFDAITTEEITTITAEDIVIAETAKPSKRRIGF